MWHFVTSITSPNHPVFRCVCAQGGKQSLCCWTEPGLWTDQVGRIASLCSLCSPIKGTYICWQSPSLSVLCMQHTFVMLLWHIHCWHFCPDQRWLFTRFSLSLSLDLPVRCKYRAEVTRHICPSPVFKRQGKTMSVTSANVLVCF